LHITFNNSQLSSHLGDIWQFVCWPLG